MNNIEIAERIINNFLAQDSNRRPFDFIKGNYSLSFISTFSWEYSPEGMDFWAEFYENRCNSDDIIVDQFLKKYYFDYVKDNNFVDLEILI